MLFGGYIISSRSLIISCHSLSNTYIQLIAIQHLFIKSLIDSPSHRHPPPPRVLSVHNTPNVSLLLH